MADDPRVALFTFAFSVATMRDGWAEGLRFESLALQF
jgi:hypothetical protein